MTQNLDQLSAAFTRMEGWPSALRETGLNNVGPLASDIATIMEAYRTGQIVAVSDDAIERVAELQLAAFLAGRGSVTSMKHGTRSAKPAPTMEQFRQMAIAAMKGTQP